MHHKTPVSWPKSLNIKIVIYFIAFAYLPLLIFSILGYYLNKDMITRIEKDNLSALNLSFADKIKAEVSFHKNLLTNEHQNAEHFKGSRFLAVYIVDDKKAREIYKSDDYREDYANLPYIEIVSDQNIRLRGYFSVRKLQELLRSDSDEIHVVLYFTKLKKRLAVNEYENGIDFSRHQLSSGILRETWNEFDDELGVFAAFTYFGDLNMVVETSINAKYFYTELDAFLNKILLANFMLAFILLGLALYYSRQITTPIYKLIKAVQSIGRGNLDQEIYVSTNDEIQILAHEFELMRQKLQESYQSMEEKIKLRTEELQGAQAQIIHQEKMASLGLMAAGIAHEIGNPLTSISSMAQVIKRKNNDEKTVEYVSNILKNINRISHIVRELVDFSKPTTHKAAPADVNEIINSAVGIIKYDRRSKNITYTLDLEKDMPKINVVADHLMQVFLNILINAVDASEGLSEEINVSTYCTNGYLNIEIKDHGTGIPDEQLNKIFEPFFTTKEVGKGTGLGLTVSYGLVKKLRGEIKVKSKMRKGSTFTVVLPVAPGGTE